MGIFILAILIWNGVILLNNPSLEQYPVRGVDVSSYQGDIDWDILASQNISFAFIKATEGSSFTDPYFDYNFSQARQTGLRVGVYHFFSFDSPGNAQAEHFIQTVEIDKNMLPPVIDLEFYGDKERNPPKRAAVCAQLDILLKTLEMHYGKKPIIYATEKSYDLYISGGYEEYDIWIRNVFSAPKFPENRRWTFWQYTDKAQLDGYNGSEKYIDMNVFYGTEEEFARYAQ